MTTAGQLAEPCCQEKKKEVPTFSFFVVWKHSWRLGSCLLSWVFPPQARRTWNSPSPPERGWGQPWHTCRGQKPDGSASGHVHLLGEASAHERFHLVWIFKLLPSSGEHRNCRTWVQLQVHLCLGLPMRTKKIFLQQTVRNLTSCKFLIISYNSLTYCIMLAFIFLLGFAPVFVSYNSSVYFCLPSPSHYLSSTLIYRYFAFFTFQLSSPQLPLQPPDLLHFELWWGYSPQLLPHPEAGK